MWFRRSCEGVEPVKFEDRGDLARRGSFKRESQVLSGCENGSKSGFTRGSTSKKEKRSSRSGRTVTIVPEVTKDVRAAGKRVISIVGNEFLVFGKPRHTPTSREKHVPTTELVVKGPVRVRPEVLADDTEHLCSKYLQETAGESVEDASDEALLVIGLDFGTSYCKVVIQEQDSGRAWAIPFSSPATDPYLLCTRVWESDGVFSLMPKGRDRGNLKMALFDNRASERDLVNATAFIALVLRYAKGRFVRDQGIEFPRTTFVWFAHMGLPARDFEDRGLVARFHRALLAGMLLAERLEPSVELGQVQRCLQTVENATTRGDKSVADDEFGEVHTDQVNLIPEIAAQIYGFLKSERFDPAQDTFLLVDVGGGTVDAGLFQVSRMKNGEIHFVFRSAAVEALGVYRLHHERIRWHIPQLARHRGQNAVADQLQALLDRNSIPAQIPGAINDYLIGVSYPERTCDWKFYNAFANMLWCSVVMAARNHTGQAVEPGKRLQFLLCGGGRSIELYDGFVARINSPTSNTSLKLHPLEIDRPRKLEPKSIAQAQYHRLSVAYGLSFEDIGTVITPEKLPPKPPSLQPFDFSEIYISKEKT